MNTTTTGLVAASIAYLVGSLPFGYLVGRLFKGTDIRKQGSGNIGATNVARTLGVKWGILVFLLDAVKGFLPVLLLPRLLLPEADFAHWHLHFEVLCGVATVLGHIFPLWLKFKGGKGVATSAGVVLVISTQATLIAAGVYLVMLWWKRIGSLASLAAAVVFPLAHALLLVFKGGSLVATTELSRTLFAVVMPLVIVACHKKNLVRLIRGEEPKFGENRKPSPLPSNGNPEAHEREALNYPSAKPDRPQNGSVEKVRQEEQELT
jgi:glycerol-3-phosphate acyltransferase PlsY